MQVLVYHQSKFFDPRSLLVNDNCKVLVYADKLTKVATIEVEGSDYMEALETAFKLTQHADKPWYDWHSNSKVKAHYLSAWSTSISDIIYLVDAQKWYMVAPVGFWECGDRWRFDGNPPTIDIPRSYDAVLGTGVTVLPGSMVLSPNQGKCKSRLERHTLTHVDSMQYEWNIEYIPIRTGWRVEVTNEQFHYWGTKVFPNPIAAEQHTIAAINRAVESYLAEENTYDEPFLTERMGFIDTTEENIDDNIPHGFYRHWFIYVNYEYELALYDPLTNDCHEMPYEGTLKEAIEDAESFIDRIEYERHVPPGQLALFDTESF